MDRRTYLQSVASLSAVCLTVGCGGKSDPTSPWDHGLSLTTPPEAASDREPFEVVDGTNVVTAGADPTGREPIDGVLNAVATDGANLLFPPGRYRLERFGGEYENLDLRGSNAVFVPTLRPSISPLLSLRGPGNVVDGFTFDYRHTAQPPTIRISGPDGWVFRNCLFRGIQQTDRGTDEAGACLFPAVTSSDGTGVIDTVYMHHGSAPPSEGDNRVGIWFGPNNEGRLRCTRLWMEQWAENTLYGHNSPGTVIVENSYFHNTNNAGTRVGGNTILRNNTYVKDGPVPAQAWSDNRLMRGIWASGGDTEYGRKGSLLVEDCDFVFERAPSTGSAIVASPPPETVVVRDCRIRQHASNAVYITGETTLTLENVQITGETPDRPIIVGPETSVAAVSGRVNLDSRSAADAAKGLSGPHMAVSNDRTVRRGLETGEATPPDPRPPFPRPSSFGGE